MGVRVAYGNRDAIAKAIEKDVVPKDSMILTKEHDGISELFFYDEYGNMKAVAERTRFLSVTEAAAWAKKYGCRGYIYSIQNGSDWSLYLVQEDYSLTPVGGASADIGNVSFIDGGSASGAI